MEGPVTRLCRSAVAVILLMAGVFVAAPAAEAAAPASLARHYASGMNLAAAGADQCDKPLSERAGGWACAWPGGVSVNSASCSLIGCWSYDASYQSTFTGSGAYGWGGSILGYTDFRIRLRFTGGSSTSRPFTFRSTRGTRSVACSGEGIYFSAAHPEGKGINGGASFRTWSSGRHAADTTVSCFGSSGYSVNAAGVAWAGVAYQIQWTDPSSAYYGTWWIWVKSPKFKRSSSGGYGLSANPPAMGTDWYGSGWDPT